MAVLGTGLDDDKPDECVKLLEFPHKHLVTVKMGTTGGVGSCARRV